jgi:lysophospholipase L1-like esterase
MTRTLAAALTLAALASQPLDRLGAALGSVGAQTPAPPPPTDCQETAAALTRLLGNDVRLRDWPQLARYREANEKLAPPQAGEARVVFMGDSITDIWQQDRFGFFTAGKPYVDRGISAQTTPQMLVRFRPDVIDLKPKVVVILAGTNDIAGNTGPMTNEDVERNLASMADLAKAHGIKVVFASITPTSAYHPPVNGGAPQTTLRPMARIKAINEWMQKYAADNGHVYLDYFTPMLDSTGVMKAELTADDLHPNAAGYAIMGPLVDAAVQRALR